MTAVTGSFLARVLSRRLGTQESSLLLIFWAERIVVALCCVAQVSCRVEVKPVSALPLCSRQAIGLVAVLPVLVSRRFVGVGVLVASFEGVRPLNDVALQARLDGSQHRLPVNDLGDETMLVGNLEECMRCLNGGPKSKNTSAP